ncbi:MAG: ribulose-phosphate 3-epimerase [Coriobacteriia bacterium]|nr:ribulose-phosphate 3-epimerase [Coriobacteriia bacterium]
MVLAPSILAADFTRLAEAVSLAEEAGADLVHVDVMDGCFVPNVTVGPPVVRALKRVTSLPLDVHLMVADPDGTVEWYLDAGADIVTVHVEASTHLHRTLGAVKEAGASAGVTLNPATPVHSLRDAVGYADLVLVMSVNPGFGGQRFIPRSVERVREIAELCADEGAAPVIQVDGGIDVATAPLVVEAGARVLVAGNAVFGDGDPAAALAAIRQAGESAL